MKVTTQLTLILVLVFSLIVTAKSNDTLKVSADIFLVKLSDNAYVHTSYTYVRSFGRVASNGLIYIANKEAFLFDTPMEENLTIDLINYIKDSLGITVAGFIANHWHDDCIGGLAYLKRQGIKSYAHNKTIQITKDKNLPVPDFGFDDFLLLKFHDKSIICKYFGAAHTSDNIVCYIPSEKILFGGCMVKEYASKSKGNLADADLNAWPITVQKVLDNYGMAQFVIPGHGAFGGKELLEHTIEMFRNNN